MSDVRISYQLVKYGAIVLATDDGRSASIYLRGIPLPQQRRYFIGNFATQRDGATTLRPFGKGRHPLASPQEMCMLPLFREGN